MQLDTTSCEFGESSRHRISLRAGRLRPNGLEGGDSLLLDGPAHSVASGGLSLRSSSDTPPPNARSLAITSESCLLFQAMIRLPNYLVAGLAFIPPESVCTFDGPMPRVVFAVHIDASCCQR